MGDSRETAEKQAGFTIIEMMVIIAILGILSAIAIPGFSEFGGRMSLKGATRKIVSDMQYAKARALKDRVTWTMQFYPGSMQYTLLSGTTPFKTVNLSEYNKVLMGSAHGDRPDEPDPGCGDGVSFEDDKIIFNSDGTSASGSIYIKNNKGDTYAVGCTSAAGRIKSWHNYGSGWEG